MANNEMVKVICPRCNGRGGWEGWRDFVCYLCRGECFRLRTASSVKAAQKRAAIKVAKATRTDHCDHCSQDVTGSRWFAMKGTELWCGTCFDGLRKP